MKKYTNLLLGVAAIIGLVGLSATPAFANSIHNVLDNNRVVIETVQPKIITNRLDSTSHTIQDYVKNYLRAEGRVKRTRSDREQWSLYIQGNRVNL